MASEPSARTTRHPGRSARRTRRGPNRRSGAPPHRKKALQVSWSPLLGTLADRQLKLGLSEVIKIEHGPANRSKVLRRDFNEAALIGLRTVLLLLPQRQGSKRRRLGLYEVYVCPIVDDIYVVTLTWLILSRVALANYVQDPRIKEG